LTGAARESHDLRMSALWAVIVLLSVIVAVDSVVIIALARQVGLLHLSAGQQGAASRPRAAAGPQPGSSLRLDVPPGLLGSQHELILYGFVRPECGACAAALRAFTEVAAGLPANERALLVSDSDEARTRAFLAANGVSLPLLTGPQLLQANDIPATPYAVVADRVGRVIAASTASSAQQLAAVLGRARSSVLIGQGAAN
jgi:peroxiredoxin